MPDSSFTFIINGHSAAHLVAADGYQWGSNDLHDEKSGRTMDGTMHVYRIGSKVALDITCIPMCADDARALLLALKEIPEFSVVYEDPEYTAPRDAVFYCSARNADFLAHIRGMKWWNHLKFTLTEC